MDWTLAIERNREALKRILAGLVAMAALADGLGVGAPTLPRPLYRAVLRLLRPAEAAARGAGFIIAKAGKPMVKVMPLEPPSADTSGRIGFMKGTGLAEWWGSLDHEALDREIAASFESSRLFPDEDEGETRGGAKDGARDGT